MRSFMKSGCQLLCLLFVVLFAGQAAAETFYVIDQLRINFRKGISEDSEIIKTLKTGTPMEILAEEGPYAKVRLHSGEEGYVSKFYINNEIPKPIIISRLEKEVDLLKKQLAESEKNRMKLTQELRAIQGDSATKERELKESASEMNEALIKSNSELQTITEKYDTLLSQSKQVVEIANERDRLQKEETRLASEVQLLQTENSKLKRTGVIKWFLAGGGVFFFGWLIGKISRKKRSRL